LKAVTTLKAGKQVLQAQASLRTGTEEPFSSPHPIPAQTGAQLCTEEGSGTKARETPPGSWRGGHFGSCEMPPMAWICICCCRCQPEAGSCLMPFS
uniref:Uncharacterized protein n=1 Tax=Falco tinnunculus TaxID=100819 RepID=A0A8C4UTA4_FALTI